MAKLKKYPKDPKSKNLDVLQKHKAKCMEVKKKNDAILKERQAVEKMKGEIKKLKTSGK